MEALVVFQGKRIRRVEHNGEWYFSVVDVIGVLAESADPRNYWKVLKHRLVKEGSNETVTNCNPLKIQAADGKMRLTDCANTGNMFRIIQSIPSPKAEPFKRWLAKVGYERVQEIENPELAQKRIKDIYRQKGYSDEWIEKRIRGIAVREELIDEWKKRGAGEQRNFFILTAEISKATFGLTPNQYKDFKSLKSQNLRDHMDDMELILTMLGEATTTRLTQGRDSKGFPKLKRDAKDGGEVAGSTRKNIEKKLGKTLVSKDNYINTPEKVKRLKN
ncbi:MAG: Bro-N domain-containing protein [Candidatus Woesearchaeota archaeon]